MTALAQLAVALLGGTWAFITLADTTVHIRGWPTITCFALANLSLACSLLVYVYGYDFLVGRIFYHAAFDIDAPVVALVQTAQQFFFLKGVIDLGVTIILGRHALISASLALLAVAYISNLSAQNQQEVVTLKPEVAEEVSLAAAKAKVEANPFLIGGFVNAASNQKGAFGNVYNNVPKDVRVARLARYLSAKQVANAESFPSGGPIRTVGDFHWGYLTREVSFAVARLDTPMEAKLLRIESPAGLYDFAHAGQTIKHGMAFVMPAGDLTATFDLGAKKAIWTGNPSAGIVKVVAARSNQGCEIFVKSKPSGAAVYFNGKEWYQRTDTSSVRDPGTWEVVVKLQGYRDWRGQRSVGAGESWTIDIAFSKLQ
ncbi:MAG TPA: PEGA domain-containing protein [Burkholderiales bacterium]|nr:PEGA domain-containing protein [Burkholderiales bacterium]